MRLSDRVTVLIIPRADAEVISFRLPAGALVFALGLFLAGLIGLGTSVFQYAGRIQRDETIARLTRHNEALEQEVGQIQDSVVRLGNDLEQLAQLERDVRINTDLSPIDPEVALLGIGGPDGPMRLWGAVEDNAATDLRRDVDGLLRKAKFQRASLSHVADELTRRKDELARIPSIVPVPGGRMTSHFGKRIDPFTGEQGMHYGVDIAGRRGDPVVATAAGRVTSTHARTGYGLTVEIDHENGMTTIYSHNSKVFVRPGQHVERGDVIAAVGSTGRATASHCHYEVHKNGATVNPRKFILSSNVILD